MKIAVPFAFILLLAACGSDPPPEQTRETTPTLSGIAAYDSRVTIAEVTGKGAQGLLRTASNSSGTNQYSISVLELSAPYMLKWTGNDSNNQPVSLYSLATREGVANITPLTTLLVAQLMGQQPGNAFLAFGSSGSVNLGAITDANLQEAQGKVIAYLRDNFGVQVSANAGNFVTAPFQARVGDPMFDSIQAVNAKLIADGLHFDTLAIRVATLARLCIEEKIEITIASERKEFCPAAKTANPREAEPTIFDYVFTSPTNDSLTVQLDNEVVVSAQYVSVTGQTYSCSGAACSGLTFGAPASDLTRAVNFALTPLNGSAGTVVLSGSLRGAIPGIALPILPCDNNKFYAILEDRSVYADCVDVNDPINVGGILNTLSGAEPSRAQYHLTNSSTSYPERPAVDVVTDGNDSIVSISFTLFEDFDATVHYYCMRSACNGVTLGPVTVNTDLDPSLPFLVRTITFDNTSLVGVHPDGTPTNTTATLKASFTTTYFVFPDSQLRFPDLMDCSAGYDAVGIEALSGPFNFCTDAPTRTTSTLPDSEVIALGMSDLVSSNTSSQLSVRILDGDVAGVVYSSPVSQMFSCAADCVGVTVFGPDENGERTVTFDGTVLHEFQSFPVPGERTVTLNGGPITFPPLSP
jgi:hypothetical protein